MKIDILKIWEFIGALSLVHWLIIIGIATLSWLLYIWRYLRLQFRFAKNLKRKVYFLKTINNGSLQTEKDLIKKIKLFNVENDIKDISEDLKVLQNLKSNAVYIVGYNPEYLLYDKLLSEAKNKNIPIIIFARQGEIKKPEHWISFNGYICCDVANTSNRLLIILTNILMIV
ncbi:hypothetical protein KJ557_00790 [Patescibacteria group bacterium]|nr:hypothetical protein [Patescibacteria group bacterium]